MTKTRPFLSTCYGYPSTTEVPPCCQAATKKLTFSTTSVLLLLNVPLSLSRGTVFRRQKNPRRGYRPKITGILLVYNEPEGKYYTVPTRPLDGRPVCVMRIAIPLAAALRVICRKYRGLCSGGSALLVFLLLLTNHASCYSCVSDLYNKGKTRNLERYGIILAEFGSTRRFVDLLRWTH